uniref:hemogen isoform X2 n=1 Tax=Myodes glareolus TaxID=447135 RepID=UPI002020BB18|nr:hemogen isoform X2 [Myodes glareolus]
MDVGKDESHLKLLQTPEPHPRRTRAPVVIGTWSLRNREQLRKRKAEAQEKQTSQWLIGEQKKRKYQRTGKGNSRGQKRQRSTKVQAERMQKVSAEEEMGCTVRPVTEVPPLVACLPEAVPAPHCAKVRQERAIQNHSQADKQRAKPEDLSPSTCQEMVVLQHSSKMCQDTDEPEVRSPEMWRETAVPQDHSSKVPQDMTGPEALSPKMCQETAVPQNHSFKSPQEMAGPEALSPKMCQEISVPQNHSFKAPQDMVGPEALSPKMCQETAVPQNHSFKAPQDMAGPEALSPKMCQETAVPQNHSFKAPQGMAGPEALSPKMCQETAELQEHTLKMCQDVARPEVLSPKTHQEVAVVPWTTLGDAAGPGCSPAALPQADVPEGCPLDACPKAVTPEKTACQADQGLAVTGGCFPETPERSVSEDVSLKTCQGGTEPEFISHEIYKPTEPTVSSPETIQDSPGPEEYSPEACHEVPGPEDLSIKTCEERDELKDCLPEQTQEAGGAQGQDPHAHQDSEGAYAFSQEMKEKAKADQDPETPSSPQGPQENCSEDDPDSYVLF